MLLFLFLTKQKTHQLKFFLFVNKEKQRKIQKYTDTVPPLSPPPCTYILYLLMCNADCPKNVKTMRVFFWSVYLLYYVVYDC